MTDIYQHTHTQKRKTKDVREGKGSWERVRGYPGRCNRREKKTRKRGQETEIEGKLKAVFTFHFPSQEMFPSKEREATRRALCPQRLFFSFM